MERKTKLLKRISINLVGALLLWFVIFKLYIVPFPILDSGDYRRPCYSPNHEYYIDRYTSPFQSLFIWPLHSKPGYAILYDKTGKNLYSGFAEDISRPNWNWNIVHFFGYWGDEHYARLPSSAGGDLLGCASPESKN